MARERTDRPPSNPKTQCLSPSVVGSGKRGVKHEGSQFGILWPTNTGGLDAILGPPLHFS